MRWKCGIAQSALTVIGAGMMVCNEEKSMKMRRKMVESTQRDEERCMC
jgi:hypothetical protein